MLYCLGLGLTSKKSYSIADKLLGFLTLVPPIFLVLTPINAASAVVLSITGYPPWDKAIIGLITVAFAGWGINTLNHYIDRKRDKVIWPERAIPSGRIKASTALASAALSLVCALLFAWFFFNLANFFILLVAIILGSAYSTFLRDKAGYLSLPPIPGLIYLGGWAAFSPSTLFTSLLPWYLYCLGVIWQAAHITIYYPLHIVNKDSDTLAKYTPPLFFFKPSPKIAASIGLGFTILTLTLSVLLPLLAPLSYPYIILVFIAGVYALTSCLRFLKDPFSRGTGFKAFASLSVFRLTTSVAILLDIFIHY